VASLVFSSAAIGIDETICCEAAGLSCEYRFLSGPIDRGPCSVEDAVAADVIAARTERLMTYKFKDVFSGAQAAFGADPTQAQAAFHAQSRLGDGVNSTVAIRQFSVDVDEPAGLGGQDTAPNPVEYVLAALGSCQEITYRLYADALGIPLHGVSVRLTGAIDLRGFFNVDQSVRPGYQNIEAEVVLDSPASHDDLARLKDIVDRHCPVLDILRNPTPVHLSLRSAELSAAAE
jgi:putative redox protein